MDPIRWQLMPRDWEPEPEPAWVQEQRDEVAACPGHLWQLTIEDCSLVDLTCELCPANVDDLLPDGHDQIWFQSGDLDVKGGLHNLTDEQVPVPFRIPVDARVISGRNYWGETEVELVIEPRIES